MLSTQIQIRIDDLSEILSYIKKYQDKLQISKDKLEFINSSYILLLCKKDNVSEELNYLKNEKENNSNIDKLVAMNDILTLEMKIAEYDERLNNFIILTEQQKQEIKHLEDQILFFEEKCDIIQSEIDTLK